MYFEQIFFYDFMKTLETNFVVSPISLSISNVYHSNSYFSKNCIQLYINISYPIISTNSLDQALFIDFINQLLLRKKLSPKILQLKAKIIRKIKLLLK